MNLQVTIFIHSQMELMFLAWEEKNRSHVRSLSKEELTSVLPVHYKDCDRLAGLPDGANIARYWKFEYIKWLQNILEENIFQVIGW